MVFWCHGWKKVGIKINGKRLSNLRLADDIVLFAKGMEQLREMIKRLLALCEELISSTDRVAKVQRRLTLGWNKFWLLRHIMKGKTSIDLKRQVFDSCISPLVLIDAKRGH
ncbi:uncharacterized protein [Halyomorpha halys]|uniref:uncharacterized protein n=1 Tax=Halyomorpha halys TaxID=286706 RepID=UPI0006D4E322